MTDRVETVAPPGASAPRRAPPPGAVDAHSHVFGPFDRHPPRQASAYALPEALPEVHAAVRRTIGMTGGVLTQPAPYGDDPSAMLAAIAASGGALRGVAAAGPDISDATLAHWVENGIVGLRFVEMRAPGGGRYPGSVGFDALRALGPRLKAYGLHAQLWASADQHAAALPGLVALGIPLVLDHFGSPDLASGTDGAAFRTIVDHLDSGLLWVKHTLCRFFDATPGFADVRPFHDAILGVRPERLLWGSDWPYVRLEPAPDAGAMLDLFDAWTPDAAVRNRVLVDNPARLYGFPFGEDA